MSYYEDVPYHTHLVDTSQYSFSEPAHYVNTIPYPLVQSNIEHACELEAYAEAAMNRSYSWDGIHPAYRDHPADSYCNLIQSPVDDDDYYDDVTDEELAEMNQRCLDYQKQMMAPEEYSGDRDKDYEETDTGEGDLWEDCEGNDDKDEDEGEGEDNTCFQPPQPPAHPLPFPPPHHIFCNNAAAASPQDILAPIPHPLAPNIWCMPCPQHQHHADHNPPDTLLPFPIPLKPNIPHMCLF